MFIDISRKDSKLMPEKQQRALRQGGPAQTHDRRKGRQIRLMTNSHKSQSEKLAADSKEAAQQKGPRPTPLTGREHVGGGSRGKSPNPAPGPYPRSRE